MPFDSMPLLVLAPSKIAPAVFKMNGESKDYPTISISSDIRNALEAIRTHILKDYRGMFRESGGALPYPFMTPGSTSYNDVLWDWDSWLTNVALRQILSEAGSEEDSRHAQQHERGCISNFLHYAKEDGWMPITIHRGETPKKPLNIFDQNMDKPVSAQHAAFLVKLAGGDAEWLRESFFPLQSFINNYRNYHRHSCGLYFWQNDCAIGVDNDPCTFYRPPRSSGSIFLNCLMFKELQAMTYLCECLNLDEVAIHHHRDAAALKAAIHEHCWDERDGFFYSVDLNLLPVNHGNPLHSGQPRDWDCLIQRIGVWSGFLALWAGIATPEQTERVVTEHYRNPKTFNAPFGVRSLSKLEKMYNVRGSGNPSSWLGSILGISNYMTFPGLVLFGFET